MGKILVTGADGMVGSAVREIFKDCDMIFTDKLQLDVRDITQVMSYSQHNINYIIHLAAETNLETCQDRQAYAYSTNTIGCANIKMLANKTCARVFYISTAGIFDGYQSRPYSIHDKPNPINHYGRSKYYGEFFLQEHFILRAGWMFGGGRDLDKKFVGKIIKKIEAGEKSIEVCTDTFGSPTYAVDLAKTIKYLMDNNFNPSKYNVTCKGFPSRYDIASQIKKAMNIRVKIIPVKSYRFKTQYPCLRSKNECLIDSDLPTLRNWKDAINEYIREYFKH